MDCGGDLSDEILADCEIVFDHGSEGRCMDVLMQGKGEVTVGYGGYGRQV